MKNNKGMVLSIYIYILLVFFLLILVAMLTVLNNTSGTNTGDQTGANLPITTPLGYTSNNQQGLDNEFATKITGIETQISANQLTFASIYGYYNFI